MQLVLAVHPLDTEATARFLQRQFQKDPLTYVVFFDFPDYVGNLEKNSFSRIRKQFPGRKKQFTQIKPEGRANMVEYAAYQEAFMRVLDRIQERLGKRRLKYVSFGGAASVCYKSIEPKAYAEAKERFGERMVRERAYLPLCWDGCQRYMGAYLRERLRRHKEARAAGRQTGQRPTETRPKMRERILRTWRRFRGK